MFRLTFFAVALLSLKSVQAHFVFVVPDHDSATAKAILSEDLEPDAHVPIDAISGTRLTCSDEAGHDTPLTLRKGEHAMVLDIPEARPAVIHGIDDFGAYTRPNSKPALLIYFPKTILGDPFDQKMMLGDRAAIELVPVGRPGELRFRFLVGGRPMPDAEVSVLLPDGTEQKVQTDNDGKTPAFAATGRYGAWARNVTPAAGDRDGKHFDETRQYATLVIDVPAIPMTVAPQSFPAMPQAASSFGAVACDGFLYMYGGHIAPTHHYSIQSVSGEFHRIDLSHPTQWQSLPGGPPLQGMNLATWHGQIFRIGGMNPRNTADQLEDVRSVADCGCYDPQLNQWTALAALPQPRSSHDLAVIGDTLFVVGGWALQGKPDEAVFADQMVSLNLSATQPRWTPLPQPFKRRALIAAAFHGKLYAMGGFDTNADPSLSVDIYDPATRSWSNGPSLPGPDTNGFGPAACVSNDHLYVSVADGSLFQLDDPGKQWLKIAAATPRIVHRMVSGRNNVLIIGGAAKQKQLDLIEAIPVAISKTSFDK